MELSYKNGVLYEQSKSRVDEIHRFEESVEYLLVNRRNNTFTMAVFDIDRFSDINKTYGFLVGNDLLNYIDSVLNSYMNETNLYCRLYDDHFALFFENSKMLDVALFVIYLTEEISNFHPNIKNKISFGICQADTTDTSMISLCNRAIYAKSTIKGKPSRLLANYDEVI